MKLGISTYSVAKAIKSGMLDVVGVIQWIKDQGGEHVEIVPNGFSLVETPDLIQAIVEKSQQIGIEISNYAVPANFIQPTPEERENEIERIIRQVDIARLLGVKRMRHDVASRPVPQAGIQQFEEDLPGLVEACRRIADYAAQYGITTSVENHGRFVQAHERVQRLVCLVDRENFKTTIDVGNFMVVDENAVIAVKKNIHLASMIHLKDFYLRMGQQELGGRWIPTTGGNSLRGSIFGHGDIDVRQLLKDIKDSGYDDYISIEFEGMEDCLVGTKIGFDNARRLWDEV